MLQDIKVYYIILISQEIRQYVVDHRDNILNVMYIEMADYYRHLDFRKHIINIL